MELTTEPTEPAGAAALPGSPPHLRRHAVTDSVSLETDDESASTSVIMDTEYVMLDDQSATVIQSSNQTDHPPRPVLPEQPGSGGFLPDPCTPL